MWTYTTFDNVAKIGQRDIMYSKVLLSLSTINEHRTQLERLQQEGTQPDGLSNY